MDLPPGLAQQRARILAGEVYDDLTHEPVAARARAVLLTNA